MDVSVASIALFSLRATYYYTYVHIISFRRRVYTYSISHGKLKRCIFTRHQDQRENIGSFQLMPKSASPSFQWNRPSGLIHLTNVAHLLGKGLFAIYL